MTLYADWKRILRKAWSIRFMAIAIFLQGCEAVLPFYSDAFPRNVFALLSLIAVVGGMISRIVYQREIP